MPLLPVRTTLVATIAGAVAGAVVAGGGVTIALASRTDPTITACAAKSSGVLRVPANGRCKSSERKVSWNSRGPSGPAGPRGANGRAVDSLGSLDGVPCKLGLTGEGRTEIRSYTDFSAYTTDAFKLPQTIKCVTPLVDVDLDLSALSSNQVFAALVLEDGNLSGLGGTPWFKPGQRQTSGMPVGVTVSLSSSDGRAYDVAGFCSGRIPATDGALQCVVPADAKSLTITRAATTGPVDQQ